MKKALLFVDDNVIIRLSVTKILKENGYNVITFKEGGEALEIFKREHFDLILTDLEMTGMNGNEMIKEIRKLDKKIPIIVLSDQYETIEIEEDVQGYLHKNISKEELIQTIDKVLNERYNEES